MNLGGGIPKIMIFMTLAGSYTGMAAIDLADSETDTVTAADSINGSSNSISHSSTPFLNGVMLMVLFSKAIVMHTMRSKRHCT